MARRITTHARRLACATLIVATAACAPIIRNHGYIPPPEDLAAVTVGVDTRESLETTIGRPATGGVESGDAWYYVREQRRRVGPLAPRTVSRELVAVSFADNGTVQNIERFGLERGRVVTLSRRVTETSIRDFGLLQQVLRNFGRIDVGDALADDG